MPEFSEQPAPTSDQAVGATVGGEATGQAPPHLHPKLPSPRCLEGDSDWGAREWSPLISGTPGCWSPDLPLVRRVP